MYKPGVQSYSKLILGRLVLLTLFRCHQIYRIMIAVSDLERAIPLKFVAWVILAHFPFLWMQGISDFSLFKIF